MIRALRTLRNGVLWGSACILTVLPIAIAADFGGVLWWTQYVAAVFVLLAAAMAIAAFTDLPNMPGTRRYLILAPLCLWACFAWLQTAALPSAVVDKISPASSSAYIEWISPFLETTDIPSRFPVSLCAFESRHAAAVLTLLIGLVWSTLTVFRSDARILFFLGLFSVGIAAHAGFAIVRFIYPGTTVWEIEMGAGSLGTFVNHNNGALFFILGLACSLGLLSHRVVKLTGQQLDDPTFEANDLLALVGDWGAAISLLTGTMCMTGILISGSRGAIVATLAGLILALGWIRRRGFTAVAVAGGFLLVSSALLFSPLQLNAQSIRNLNFFSGNDTSTLLNDGRVTHWGDGWRAAVAHLPGGSGLSTYSYAYLPHQQSGSDVWYHHAENLWLELVAEQGLFGIVITAAIVLMVIQHLRRLGDSPNPIDQGLRVSGWFALGAIVVSQVFDFGLIIPANLFVTCILFSIVLSRDAITSDSKPVSRPVLWRNFVQAGFVCSLVAIATIVSVIHLGRDAREASLLRTAAAHVDASRGDPSALAEWSKRLDVGLEERFWPALNDLRCEVEYAKLRLEEVTAAAPATAAEAVVLYDATRPSERRLAWRRPILGANAIPAIPVLDPKDAKYDGILAASQKSLLACPLAPEPRKWQLYLDFVHRDRSRSDAAVSQLTQFYRGNPEMLVRLAELAAGGEDYLRAAELLSSAITLSAEYTSDALEMTDRWDALSLEEILKDKPEAWRSVASDLLERRPTNTRLLNKCRESLECESCETNRERAECEASAAGLALQTDEQEIAFEHYQTAIKLSPVDVQLRYEFVRSLQKAGRRKEARRQAQIARDVLPDEGRFDTIIQQMADEDRLPAQKIDDVR